MESAAFGLVEEGGFVASSVPCFHAGGVGADLGLLAITVMTPGQPTSSATEAAAPRLSPSERRRRRAGLVALGRARLARSFGARCGFAFAVLVAVGFAAAAVVARVSDGGDTEVAPLVARAARWIAWLGGAPLALAAARARFAVDRAEGVDALAASRGFSSRALESGRVLGAMLETGIVLGAPLTLFAAFTVALAVTPHAALARMPLVLGAAAFGVVAGATLGALGAVCGRVAGRRGRLVLAAVVLLPWAAAAELGHTGWSIPGALEAVRTQVLPSRVREVSLEALASFVEGLR